MSTKSFARSLDVNLWNQVIRLEEIPSATVAKELLKLQFSEGDRQRMRELAEKARAGTLSADEERLIENYERLGCLLDILHSKSRRALKQRRKTA